MTKQFEVVRPRDTNNEAGFSRTVFVAGPMGKREANKVAKENANRGAFVRVYE